MTSTAFVERERMNQGERYSAFLIVPFWAIVQVATFFFGFMGLPSILDGMLFGPDSYMRMQRITLLNETWEWFDNVIPRANAPYGEALQHWSRPLDVLVIVLSWPFRLLLDMPDALFTAAVLVSPLLQLATVLVLMRTARLFGGGERRLSIGILFLLQPGLIHLFFPGRPDHHSLILFFFSLSVFFTLKLVVEPFSRSVALLAGVVSATGLWVSSADNAVTFPATVAVMGFFWVFSGRDLGCKGFYFSLALIAVITLALLLERPLEVALTPHFDRVSVIHWTLSALVLVYWFGARAMELKDPTGVRRARRLVFSVVWLVAAIGVLLTLFPQLLGGPLAGAEPEIWAFMEEIREMQPVVSWEQVRLSRLINWMGTTLLVMPYLLWLIFRGADLKYRSPWMVVSWYLLVFISLPFLQVRWTSYTLFLSLFPYAELLTIVLAKVPRNGGELLRSSARAAIRVVFCILPVVVGLSVMTLEGSPGRSNVRSCAPRPIAEFLDEASGFGDRPRTVLAGVFFGPELLYWSRHRVVGVPYHTSSSIPDTKRFFNATDPSVAREVVMRRAVDLVLVCAGPDDVEQARLQGASNMRQRLVLGQQPAWLTEVALPPGLAQKYKLFEVTL